MYRTQDTELTYSFNTAQRSTVDESTAYTSDCPNSRCGVDVGLGLYN